MTEPLRTPKIIIQTPEFLLNLKGNSGVLAYTVYLQSIAHYTRIEEYIFEFIIGHLGYLLYIPVVKKLSIVLSFAEHSDP